MVRLRLAADPAQDKIDRRNELNLYRVWIQRVFSRRERRTPDTAMSRFDLFAVTERFAGGIVARGAMIRNDHADVTNRNQRLRLDLNRAKPAIDEECAVGQIGRAHG